MESSIPIIPTSGKDKIPSTCSWPVGAEEISRSLKGLPQFSELTLSFRYDQWGMKYRTWIAMVEARYRRREKRLFDSQKVIESGVLDRHWKLTINAIPREHRKVLHDRVLEEMPKIVAWLSKRATLDAVGDSYISVVWSIKRDEVYTSSTIGKIEPERA